MMLSYTKMRVLAKKQTVSIVETVCFYRYSQLFKYLPSVCAGVFSGIPWG